MYFINLPGIPLFSPLGKIAERAIYFACANFFSFLSLFLMIARRTIISGSTELIFYIFSPNESVLGADYQSGPLFPISQGTLPWQVGNQFCEKMANSPSFIALELRNGMEYRYLSVRIKSENDASISCKNFVNFGPVTPELKELICERLDTFPVDLLHNQLETRTVIFTCIFTPAAHTTTI